MKTMTMMMMTMMMMNLKRERRLLKSQQEKNLRRPLKREVEKNLKKVLKNLELKKKVVLSSLLRRVYLEEINGFLMKLNSKKLALLILLEKEKLEKALI